MGANKSLFDRCSPDGSSEHMPAWLIVVLEQSSFAERISILSLGRKYRAMSQSDKFWRFLTMRLSIERGIYVPPVLLPGDRTWRLMFHELFRARNMWAAEETPVQEICSGQYREAERFKISVFARFRPAPVTEKAPQPTATAAPDDEETMAIVLPLHQRLSMIRMSGKAGSNRDALRILASEGEWFQKKWCGLQDKAHAGGEEAAAAAEAEGRDKSVEKENSGDGNAEPRQAAQFLLDADTRLRLRPGEQPLAIAKAKPDKTIARVQSLDPGSGRVVMLAPDVGLREFSFDGVLPLNCTQQSAYDTTTRRLVVDFINGYNATAIAYGQTASGKTHTMFGPPPSAPLAEKQSSSSLRAQADIGIIPRACAEVLAAIAQPSRAALGLSAAVAVSYVEIYGDLVSDLLKNGARCGHNKVSSQRYVLSGAAEKRVSTLDDVYSTLALGEAHKRRASTAMNDRSSRAHSLFILTLQQTCERSGVVRTSRLFLADLGGSEQVKKSKVEAGGHRMGLEEHFSAGFNKGEHMREAVNINLGLLALKRCIESLNFKVGSPMRLEPRWA